MDLKIQDSFALAENEILDRMLSGEKELYEILIRRNNALLYRVGRSYALRHADVQDMMQETYLSAYQDLKNFQRRSSFTTWIIRIMVNKCLQKIKSISKKSTVHVNDAGELNVKFTDNAEQKLLRTEMAGIIENGIENLPENYRLVFILREIEGLNVAETSTALGITEINVKVRLNRAKAMLRNFIEKSYPAEEIYAFHLRYCNVIVDNVLQQMNRGRI